jgi:hypothetical protein
MSVCTLLPRWGNTSPFPRVSIALYIGREIIVYYYDYRLSIRTHYKDRSLWQRVSSFYDMWTRKWIRVSKFSKKHSNFISKNLVVGTFTTWKMKCIIFFFFNPPMPPHVLVDFMVFPPRHGSSVTDFWGWDAHEAQLRCPDDVSGDIGGWSARKALKPKFY